MRKILALVSAALLVSSCSCSAKNASSEVSDSNVDYYTLDSTWECEFLKFPINSNWEVEDEFKDSTASVFFSWKEDDKNYSIHGYFSHHDSFGKKSVAESEKNWEELISDMQKDDPDYYKDAVIEDSFVKNGQPFLVISGGDLSLKEILFYGDTTNGTFYIYNEETESTVMDMIDGMTFYNS
jgi:hypothetical protein